MTQRAPRLLDPGFISWLHKRPCCACGRSPAPDASHDAAHLKAGNVLLGKPWAGTVKPDDRWATTLCRSCHNRQHAHGDEIGWWNAHGIDPFALAQRLYAQYRLENPNANPPYVRKQRSIKTRQPRGQRQKIKGRAKPWPHRPFPGKHHFGG